MASEEEINTVYEDFLAKKDNIDLISTLQQSYKLAVERYSDSCALEDYERNQIVQIILNIDWTGRLDCDFEDVRKSISTNDSCG